MQSPTIITITNDKGGTGKSTITVNFAVAAAALFSIDFQNQKHSKDEPDKVLIIDTDPQGSSLMTITGRKLGDEINLPENTLGLLDQYLQDNPAPPLISSIQKSPLPLSFNGNLDYIPASQKGMNQLSERLPADSDPQKMFRMANMLEEIKNNYRLIVIDTAPNQYWITINALVASTHILIPVRLSAYDIDSMVRTFDTIENAMNFNPKLEILGIIPNAVRSYTNLHKELHQVLDSNYHDLLLPKISLRSSITKAQSLGLDIFSYKPPKKKDNVSSSDSSTIEFLELTQNIFSRIPQLSQVESHG